MVPRGCTELSNAPLGELLLWGGGEVKSSAMKTRPAAEWDGWRRKQGKEERPQRCGERDEEKEDCEREYGEIEAKGRRMGRAGGWKRKRKSGNQQGFSHLPQ